MTPIITGPRNGEQAKYADLYGNFPSSFSTAVRALMKDEAAAQNAHWQLKRLLRGGSVRAASYFAAKTYWKYQGSVNADSLINLMDRHSIAALLGIIYLYRRAKKRAEEKEFALLTSDIHVRAEAGGFVGIAIPQIGFSVGLLAATIPYLAMAAFLLHDAKGFTEYRRRLKQSRRTSNIPEEMSRWGCSHAQIASSLLIGLGFPSDLAASVHRGLEMQELGRHQDPAAYVVVCANLWTSELLKTGAPLRWSMTASSTRLRTH